MTDADWIRVKRAALLPMRPADATDRLEWSTTVSVLDLLVCYRPLASILCAALLLLFRAARTPQYSVRRA